MGPVHRVKNAAGLGGLGQGRWQPDAKTSNLVTARKGSVNLRGDGSASRKLAPPSFNITWIVVSIDMMTLRRQIRRIGKSAALSLLDRYPRIVFVHVPKCAGSAVRDSLYDAVYPALLRSTRVYCEIDVVASVSAGKLLGLDAMTCREAVLIHALSDPFTRFIAGHIFANPAVVEQFSHWKFVTVLREPTSRFISAYVFNRYRPFVPSKIECNFADFLETDRARLEGSRMTQYFSGMSERELEERPAAGIAAALQNLDRFLSVGFVDDLRNWERRISGALGRRVRIGHRNTSPKPDLRVELEQSPALRTRLEELCAIDREFYASARAHLKQSSSVTPADAAFFQTGK